LVIVSSSVDTSILIVDQLLRVNLSIAVGVFGLMIVQLITKRSAGIAAAITAHKS